MAKAEQKIHLLDALRIMEARSLEGSQIPFSIEVCTSKGELQLYESAVIASANKPQPKPKTTHAEKTNKKFFDKGLRLIRTVDTNEIRTVKIWRIMRVNNMRVKP